MKRSEKKIHVCTALILVALLVGRPCVARAAFLISEIMYDVPGGDAGHEWVEIHNTGTGAHDISSFRFLENDTRHKINLIQGESIPPNGFGVIADDAVQFKIDYPSYGGVLYDSSFSLSNSGETLTLLDGDSVLDEVTYVADDGASSPPITARPSNERGDPATATLSGPPNTVMRGYTGSATSPPT